MNSARWYSSFSRAASRICGRSSTFVVAVAAIGAWAVTGPLFGFSDTRLRALEAAADEAERAMAADVNAAS